MANQKTALKGNEILKNIEALKKKKFFHLELKGLTKPTRDILSELVNGILSEIGANPLAGFHLFSGLMEALLNAIKANIRHIIFRDELLKKLEQGESSRQDAEDLLEIIMETSMLRDAMHRYIVPEKVKKQVQSVLFLEDKIRTKKKDLTETEKTFLTDVRTKIKKYNMNISLKIRITSEDLSFRIRNDSPIHHLDFQRIQESRLKHKELFDRGNSADFFRPEFLNEKESAGFGIAMIDEGFYSIGLNPLDLLTITSGARTTTVYMKYPITGLKMEF
ncbi:hypothetical protein [Leptospira noguchii]|uniref:Uncharacterized protein n=6 Tax=Leptospira TaxID=171 RepID=M6VCY4_9LEPT|nr:hypothetical protein [Leptospira noguchii]EKR72925.1 hypothetical protein LEP1GSC041_3840 [Leptospira noguchii str. 2006001870]EMI64266.1 hypothetical protein LEP1GSC072_2599 [Leptospira noguchii str. Bonito]EMN01150.1 hypothetical protein LEP1GSC035_3937 [Leptospira noguchii str. 2007001578]EMO41635.1 hypothetical protein LEP1GSC186_2239 [Leptospira noguchii serovar Autumnalis str. ZUN142]EMO55332.1 hypothetical protein LEP1GSC172_1501 [Leptospira noguchii]